jgi:hypothetical protein
MRAEFVGPLFARAADDEDVSPARSGVPGRKVG